MNRPRAHRSGAPAAWPAVALVALLLALPAALRAEEMAMADSGGADPLGVAHYVIKVTPTLAYLDVGTAAGATPGQAYVILREEMGRYVPVAEVRVLRVFDSFSIAETYLVQPGEEVAVLQRAVIAGRWAAVAPELAASGAPAAATAPPAKSRRTRSIMVLGGLDAGKDVDLVYVDGRLTGAESVGGGAVGLRLAKVVSPHWRLALTYRVSGEALGGDADVTQLSIELDTHYLLRGNGQAGPYLGLGVGMHQLGWDSAANLDDTAYKSGVNLVAGLDIPLGGGAVSLLAEGGMQRVMDWNGMIDVSNLRALAGLAVNF